MRASKYLLITRTGAGMDRQRHAAARSFRARDLPFPEPALERQLQLAQYDRRTRISPVCVRRFARDRADSHDPKNLSTEPG